MEKIHFAIKNEDISPKSKLLDKILNGKHPLALLKDKKGLLYDNLTLEKLIEKEAKYNTKTISNLGNRSISSFSSGEQKKAFLNYLIQQKPEFLILNSPFESLDTNSVAVLKNKLIQLSNSVNVIQVFDRKEEILPIITHILEIRNDEITAIIALENYIFKEEKITFKGEIPKPISSYKNVPNQLISLQNVSVKYNEDKILNDINWTINKNEFWQLIGPNGSGKSTILSMIYGNNVKAYGQNVFLFGQKKGSGESVWEIKEKIGYFNPSMLSLFNRKSTVKQMIISGFFDSIGLYTQPSLQQIKTAENWINLLGLENVKNEPFQNLSVVTQRLVLIARAIIKHPPLLILDEPLLNLNDKGTAIIVTLINKIALESDITIIFVSHRNVKNLEPNFTYELIPSKNGSFGKVKNNV